VKRSLVAPLLAALALRVLVLALTDRVVVDIERYRRVGEHLLDVSWNPYETRRLYPYPPPWAAVEAGSLWLSRHGMGSFPVLVRLPVLAADLGIVALLFAAARAGRASPGAAWLYATHPVALLVGGAHGQFDAVVFVFVLLALEALARGRRDASALALAGAIATKSFPLLLLPFLAGHGRAPFRSMLRYAALATVPVAALLLPFALADAPALRRELLAYSGVADFGWAGLVRGLVWLGGGGLWRSEARFWPLASLASKGLFLAAWVALVALDRVGRGRLDPARASLATVLAFLTCYGLLSAQYLLWAVPLGLLLRPGRAGTFYAGAATLGLVGFYLFLAPGVLFPRALAGCALLAAGRLWVAGVGATLVASAAWLVTLLRGGSVGLRASTEAT
jgi:hypothetical protein